MTKWIYCFSVAASLLVFSGRSNASSIVCGLGMTTPDCQPVPAEYQWAPDSQPTFAVGCLGYPSPDDAGQAPTPIVPSGSSLRFKLEADSQEITGGTFSETGIRCGEPCDPDAEWRSCNPSTLVRYVGPLAQGQQHKITLTGMGMGGSPSCLFNVSGVAVDPTAARDASVVDGVGPDLLSPDAALAKSDRPPLLSEDAHASTWISDVSPSVDDWPADALLADAPGAGGSTAGGTAVRNVSHRPPAGCSCTVGQTGQASPKLVALLALLLLTRVRRPQRNHS